MSRRGWAWGGALLFGAVGILGHRWVALGWNAARYPVARGSELSQALVAGGFAYVAAGAKVLVNGALCAACSATFDAGAGTSQISLAPAPSPAGTYVVQLLNPEGFASNELPVVTTP